MTLSNLTDTPFKDFVSAEQVDEKSAMALINRAEDFKAGNRSFSGTNLCC